MRADIPPADHTSTSDAEFPLWTTPGNPRPFWIPEDQLESCPEDLKVAIEAVIVPAYGDLVLAAKPGLQQSIGLTIVHLMWLEVLDMSELNATADPSSDSERREERERAIERLLKLTGAKVKCSGLLLRLNELRQRFGQLVF